MEYLIGADEAGRAPLAGPVSVGIIKVPLGFDVAREFPGVRDSKKVTPQKREELYLMIKDRAAAGELSWCVRFSDHTYIDQFGITRAVRRALWSGVRYLAPAGQSPLGGAHISNTHVFLDGLLHAPHGYAQETIVGGDDLVPLISLASIVAKVERDRLMRRLAKKFPQYGFEKHKGYPTPAHYAAIEAHGICEIHRRTYGLENVPMEKERVV